MRAHIHRLSVKPLKNATLLAAIKMQFMVVFLFNIAEGIRVGHAYPVNKAILLFLSDDAQSTFEKNLYLPMFRIHSHYYGHYFGYL